MPLTALKAEYWVREHKAKHDKRCGGGGFVVEGTFVLALDSEIGVSKMEIYS